MKVLFLMFHDSILRYLVPKLISAGEDVYAANKNNFHSILSENSFDYVIIDIDNCNFNILDLIKEFSRKKQINWIMYTYHYDETFIEILKNEKIKGVLSKNIHPEYLHYKIQNILYEKKEFLNLRRKFYRANVEPQDNVKVYLHLPTLRTPIFGMAKELSIIGMHVALNTPGEIICFREGLYLSKIFLSLNGHRLFLSGKIIRLCPENGMVLLFDKMNNFAHEKIAKYIYKSIDNYLTRISTKCKV